MIDMKIYILDLYSIIFKNYYAIQGLRNSKAFPTNAIFGTIKSILKIIREYKVENLIIVMDTGKKTFRQEIYSEYKSNRLEAPDDLKKQFPIIKDILAKLNFKLLELDGVEADDLIFSLVKKFYDDMIFIITSDKDLYQLINDNVKIITESKYTGINIIGRQESINKFGVSPEQMVDFLSLTGDSSDNIPGVAGIGPKRAIELLNQFGSLDNIYSSLDKIKSESVRKKIIEGKDSAYTSKKLIELKNVEINLDKSELKIRNYNFDSVMPILKELELSSIIKELIELNDFFQNQNITADAKYNNIAAALTDQQSETYNKIESSGVQHDLFTFNAGINKNSEPAELASFNAATYFFVQTDIFKYADIFKNSKKIFLYVFNFEKKDILIVSDFVNYLIFKNISVDAIENYLRNYIFNFHNEIIFYNTKEFLKKYFYSITEEEYEILNKKIFDLSIAIYLIDSDEFNISLERIINKFLFKTVYINIDFKKSSFELVLKYYQYLIANLNEIKNILMQNLKEINGVEIYNEIEIPLSKILFFMEKEGIKIDKDYLCEIREKILNDINIVKSEIYKYSDSTLNLNSPKQLAELLFEKLNLPKLKKTKTGFSTDNEVLEQLKFFHPLPTLLLEYRTLTKLENTYISTLLELEKNGKIHTTFNQCITTTGRLSSSEPNLQNIPVQKEDKYSMRKIFISEEKSKLISADYSQIELRILAHLSGDEIMIEAFKNNEDIHLRTAKEIFGNAQIIDKKLRRIAKTVNFGIIYGMSAFRLSKDLSISRTEAENYISKYFDRYKTVKEYLNTIIEFARKNGYVETMFNRRRYIRDINDKNRNIREGAERMAINMPVQGTAADILKMAMIKLFNRLKPFKTKMILTVHDELVFNSADNEIEELSLIIKTEMENIVKLDVPLKVDLLISKTWGG